jgi:hypothetical protein
VCLISSAPDALLTEVEEAWRLRDAGFNAAWVCDCLYKAGADPAEQAGAIIGAMKAKSSVKWFSAKGKSGRGEGAKECECGRERSEDEEKEEGGFDDDI